MSTNRMRGQMHGMGQGHGFGRVVAPSMVILGLAAASLAAEIPKGDVTIRLEPVATGLTAPVGATHAGDGSGRLFIVEQSGQIRIVQNGVVLATPFLDLSGEIPALNPFFDERGLLGLAFHPDYADNGRFFVRYSKPRAGDPSEPCFGTSRGCHEEILAEFTVSADPNVANPVGTILFRIDEPQFNHDSGDVAFGPDGFLYFTLGDGGGAHDGLADVPPSHGPIGNGQNIETALGNMLRIDVDSPPQAPLAYAIPPDNPFVDTNGVDEIYAYGMRNPFKFSFDDGPGGDGRLLVADVGQNLFEEVSIVVNGGNYGWVLKEGFHCFDPFDPLNPPDSCSDTGLMGEPLLDPIVEYSHPGSGFDPEGGITVIGGFVYRGSRSPGLVGKYVFGDFAQQFVVPSGSLYFLDAPEPGAEIEEFIIGPDDVPYGLFLKGFGEDEDGEVYACGSTALAPFGDTGVVERIVVPPQANLDIKPGACPNSFNRASHGVLPVALVGTDSFDASQVDLSTIRLSRADGVGGMVAPIEGPPGPHSELEDVATPFDGELCDCHDLGGDGSLDLSMKFRTDDVVEILELDDLSAGALVELVVTGNLLPGGGSGTTIFNFDLDGAQEVPPTGSPGTGNCTVMLNESTGGVSVSCTYEGLVGTAVAAHIHGLAPAGAPAGVIVPLLQSGGMSGTITGGGTLSPAQVQGMLDGLTYVNLHTDAFPPGEIRGQIEGGEAFAASDCVRLVPPGTPPGLLSVRSNRSDAWIEVSPPDEQLDGGGFADFDRTYPEGSVVTLTATSSYGEREFLRWMVDGAAQPRGQTTIQVTVEVEEAVLTAVYSRPPRVLPKIDLNDFAAPISSTPPVIK